MGVRVCAAADCGEVLPAGRRKWCSDACRLREKSRIRRLSGVDEGHSVRPGQRGVVYRQVAESDMLPAVLKNVMSVSEFAEYLGRSQGAVSKALDAYRADMLLAAKSEGWLPDGEVCAMLMIDPETGAELKPASRDDEAWFAAAADAFVTFSNRFFRVRKGVPYIIAPFHRRWIVAILKAIYFGEKLMILSPPRHGKSELLVHFAVWLIARNPDIAILWVGGNSEIASDMVSSVRDELEHNTELIDAVLPPDTTWAPTERKGAQWTSTRFRVANRTLPRKAATMTAVGRNGKILSRDADFIISDDIEDHESVQTVGSRNATRSWFTTQLDSRKEEHTGWVLIGSRQHHEDLYGYLLDDDEWHTDVSSAHRLDCTIDPHNLDAHTDCMLFPQIRSYRWLYAKRRSAAALGLEDHFEMVYLNVTKPQGATIFVRDEMEQCFDPTRPIGYPNLTDPQGNLLPVMTVAGLDPAATGYQAGFMWGYSPHTHIEYMIDLDNRAGGGIDAFLQLAQLWLERYNLRLWVIEDMGFQKGYRQEKRVQQWAERNGVTLLPHTTGRNKTDPQYGVGAMSGLYRDKLINLPYGSAEAKEKTELLVRQAVRFSNDRTTNRKRLTDALMASWFPQRIIENWKREQTEGIKMQYEPMFADYRGDQLVDVPW